MTVRAPISKLARGDLALGPESTRYLVRVLRLRAGDSFIAFDSATKLEADATLVDETTARVGELRPAQVIASTDLVLVYALAKGDKVDDVVRDATELGATRVIVARSSRSVVKVDEEKAEARRARWTRIAEQAARQCGRADPPVIDGVLDWDMALTAACGCAARFCLDPHANESLGSVLPAAVATGASIAFAIGPEGGLIVDEVTEAAARGFVPVSLGAFVLRTETVAAAILGTVRVLTPR